jgi:hypothetical protein
MRPNATEEDEVGSPFLRACIAAQREEDPAPEISSEQLADRLVSRFNHDKPLAPPLAGKNRRDGR